MRAAMVTVVVVMALVVVVLVVVMAVKYQGLQWCGYPLFSNV